MSIDQDVMKIANIPGLLDAFRQAVPLLEKFCNMYKVELIKIDTTEEQGVLELMYIFPKFGGYTIDGIEASLEPCCGAKH